MGGRAEKSFAYSLAWGLGISLKVFSGLMTLFANTQTEMSRLVYKLQTVYCFSAQYFPSRPVWSFQVQAWVSSSLPLGQRREKEKKGATWAKYLPMKESMSAIHSHVSPPHCTIYPFHVQHGDSTVSLLGEFWNPSAKNPCNWCLNTQKPNNEYWTVQKPKKDYKIGTKVVRGEIIANCRVKKGFIKEEEMNLSLF